jgi:cytochrome c553
MEGGYIPKEWAKDVACYIMELRKKPCKKGYKKDAPLYFSSNCSGCHGTDAKGIKGIYPNLLREPFLGK